MQYCRIMYQQCKVCNGEVAVFLDQFELLKCSKCGFVFYKYPLSGRHVAELYDKLYNVEDGYAPYKRQAALLKKGIQPHLGYEKRKVLNMLLKKKCKKITEIGAGVGIVGNYLQKKNVAYHGIELDKEAAKLAKEAAIEVSQGSFEYLSHFRDNDAVLGFEVLEHIDDIKLCFEFLQNSVKPGGFLGFTVPNFNRFYNLSNVQQQKGLGQIGPPVHINFFTLEFLKNILPLFGFQPYYLHTRCFPDLNWKRRNTYQRLWYTFIGKYQGPTIICVAQRIQ